MCGVSDFLEVKFNENRINGQSKGFCCVSLGSDTSLRIVMEKLVKQELHGQTPVVTYATKTALMQFEAQSKTRAPQQSQQQQPMSMNMGPPGSLLLHRAPSDRATSRGRRSRFVGRLRSSMPRRRCFTTRHRRSQPAFHRPP